MLISTSALRSDLHQNLVFCYNFFHFVTFFPTRLLLFFNFWYFELAFSVAFVEAVWYFASFLIINIKTLSSELWQILSKILQLRDVHQSTECQFYSELFIVCICIICIIHYWWYGIWKFGASVLFPLKH